MLCNVKRIRNQPKENTTMFQRPFNKKDEETRNSVIKGDILIAINWILCVYRVIMWSHKIIISHVTGYHFYFKIYVFRISQLCIIFAGCNFCCMMCVLRVGFLAINHQSSIPHCSHSAATLSLVLCIHRNVGTKTNFSFQWTFCWPPKFLSFSNFLWPWRPT